MEKSFNSIAWREAATGGFYMGLTYAILAIAGHLMRSHTGVASLAGALGFFSIAGFLYFYSSRMAALRGAAGFSFGQSMAFVLRMSLFAGILGGLLGLIVSLFVKRHGDPFAGANNGQNGTMPPQSE